MRIRLSSATSKWIVIYSMTAALATTTTIAYQRLFRGEAMRLTRDADGSFRWKTGLEELDEQLVAAIAASKAHPDDRAKMQTVAQLLVKRAKLVGMLRAEGRLREDELRDVKPVTQEDLTV